MSQISSIYGSKIARYDVTRKDKNKPKDRIPYCICFSCNERKITKRLSKKDRKKYKRKHHPICTDCRTKLQKLGIYRSVIQEYLSK